MFQTTRPLMGGLSGIPPTESDPLRGVNDMADDITFREGKRPAGQTIRAEDLPPRVRFEGDELVADDAPHRPPPLKWSKPPHRPPYQPSPSGMTDLLMALLGIGAIIGWGLLLINLFSADVR